MSSFPGMYAQVTEMDYRRPDPVPHPPSLCLLYPLPPVLGRMMRTRNPTPQTRAGLNGGASFLNATG